MLLYTAVRSQDQEVLIFAIVLNSTFKINKSKFHKYISTIYISEDILIRCDGNKISFIKVLKDTEEDFLRY